MEKSEKGAVKVLFFNILINILPYIISNIIKGFHDTSYYTALVGVIFIIQTVVNLLFIYRTNKIMVTNKSIILVLLLMVVLSVSVVFQIIFSKNNFNNLDIIYFIARIINLFSIFIVFKDIILTKKAFQYFISLLVKLAIFASIINLIINIKYIPRALITTNPYEFNFMSFFLNRNTFAQLLMLAIMGQYYLTEEKKSYQNILILGFLAINLVLTFSRTAIASLIFFLIIYHLIYFKKNPKKVLIRFMFAAMFLLMLMVIPQIRSFIINILIRSNVGTANRFDLWKVALSLLRIEELIFGVGQFTAIKYANEIGITQSQFHSIYIDIILSGGLVLLLLFIILMGYLVRNALVIIKKDFNTGNFLITMLISISIYSIFESVNYFQMGYVATLFTIYSITIPSMYYNNFRKRREYITDEVNNDYCSLNYT